MGCSSRYLLLFGFSAAFITLHLDLGHILQKNKETFSSTLGFWALMLITEITAFGYYGLGAFLAKPFGEGLMMAVCFMPMIFLVFLFFPTFAAFLITVLVSFFSNFNAQE